MPQAQIAEVIHNLIKFGSQIIRFGGEFSLPLRGPLPLSAAGGEPLLNSFFCSHKKYFVSLQIWLECFT